jgi:sodium-dependent dicarboxylate transporter 2/3/5
VFEELSRRVGQWDAQTQRPGYRLGGALLGVAVLCVILALPLPDGLPEAGRRTAAVAALMALWWVGRVFPMAVTALVPLVAFPLLGVASVKAAAAPFAHPLNFLMLGGFLLAAGMERVGLHRRLTALVLRPAWVRSDPRRVVLALMAVTAALSGLVSNTATTVMMLPLALSLGHLCSDNPRTVSGFALALAYAASIGGVWSLVGTPPNAVFAAEAAAAGFDVGFAQWMALGLPFTILALPLAWLVVTRVVIPIPRPQGWSLDRPATPEWEAGERPVLGIVALAMFAWMSRSQWQDWLPYSGSELDAMVALAAAAAVFLLPGPMREGSRGFLLTWSRAETAVPWSVLLLLGGGFSLATQIKATALTAWLASGAEYLEGWPLLMTTGAVTVSMTFITELTSNTASTQIALPLMAEAAVKAGVSPLIWMIAATMSASCAFMMPVATAPNAIAVEAGGVSPADMALAGILLNGLLAGAVALWAVAVVPVLF